MIKVKDPNFSKSNINPLVIQSINKTYNIPAFKNKYTSSNFIPLSMAFHIYYGVLISKNGSNFEFIYNNRIIKVLVVEFMVEHIVSIFEANGDFLGRVLDVM